MQVMLYAPLTVIGLITVFRPLCDAHNLVSLKILNKSVVKISLVAENLHSKNNIQSNCQEAELISSGRRNSLISTFMDVN